LQNEKEAADRKGPAASVPGSLLKTVESYKATLSKNPKAPAANMTRF
jgi:hypothetical protein